MSKKSKIQLNQEQKNAIEHESGPLLVIAGAGTGKTRVITERIKWLINQKHVGSKNILALTFTEKAAQEMANRVDDVMPLGYEEPYIYTFHAFADRILKEEGLEMGLDPSYKILSGPDQWLLLRKHLFSLDLKYFRPLGNPTKFISAILKFISRLQDENISADDMTAFSNSFSGEVDEKERWQELAYVYRRYQEIKMENSKIDFGDLITLLIKLFQERPNILRKYQNQFQHILLDEFQDTNYAQYLLVKILCPQEMDKRSLLVVGDDSQSIYKFRGAAVSNILEFKKDYPKTNTITLLKNYRSTQQILDPAYKLIKNNNPDTLEAKLGISKELASQQEIEGLVPKIISTETIEEEVETVIEAILEILAKEPTYTYKDVAILARANGHLDAFVMALRKYGLPYQLVGNRGLYDQDEVRDILALLKVIVNPKDSINLYRVLNIEPFSIPKDIITNILSEAKNRKEDMWKIVNELKNSELDSLKNLINRYQEKITKSLPVDFVYNLVNDSDYLKTYLTEDSIENQLSIKNLNLFLKIIKTFEVDYRNENNEIPTVVALLDYLEMMIEAGDNPAQAEIEDIDTINLLTVHASKGLEFPAVFMVNLVTGRFPTRNRSDPINIPEDLIKEVLPEGDPHIQEERRLFYVGMTRAQKYLYMTFAKNYGGKKEHKQSGYLAETGLKVSQKTISKDINNPLQPGLFGTNSKCRDPVFSITDFTPRYFSYSQMSSYTTCPLQYKYAYVLNVPSAPSHALSFGVTIHDTLRDYHQKSLFSKTSLEDLYKAYEKNWQPLGYEDEKHRVHQFEEGKRLLNDYYERHKNDEHKPVALEKSFNLRIAGVKFFGRIDRIDKSPNGVEIIDYKTGKTKTQKEVDKDDQIAIYAVAAKDALSMNPEKLTYYFLESGEKISTSRTKEQLVEIKEKTQNVLSEIKEGKFEPKSGMHCQWCDYRNLCPFAYKN